MSNIVVLETRRGRSNYNNSIKDLQFASKEVTLVKENGTMISHLLIVLENKKTGIYKGTGYSKYFFSVKNNGLLNRKIRTKEIHAHIIVNFLNYVLIDNYDTYEVKNIKDITVEMGNDFLRDYSNGLICKRKPKSSITIESAERQLTKFYRFLYENNNMKYLKSNDNDYWNVSGREVNKRFTSHSIFTVLYPNYDKSLKIKNISIDVVGEFLRVADEYYPEITLAIALQAFGGLRAGEVFSIATYMINIKLNSNGIGWFEVDLRKEKQLRVDKTRTGQIKKPRIQPIHPAFIKVLNQIYEKHMIRINAFENIYQPLFLNRNGEAMIKRSYYHKFGVIRDNVIERFSNHNSFYIRSEANALMNGKLSPHTLRYFFTQFLTSTKDLISATEIAYWRGDSSLDSAITYLSSSPVVNDKIREFQEDLYHKLVE